MKLSREERRAILCGERPKLAWARAQDCPFEAGEVIVLKTRRGPDARRAKDGPPLTLPPDAVESPQVWLTVTQIRRTKRGGVVAEYRVRDDTPHLLANGNGYTSAPQFSPDPEAEALDDEVHGRLHRESKVASSMRREFQRVREEKLRLEQKLNEARYLCKPGRVKILQTHIERVDRRLEDAA